MYRIKQLSERTGIRPETIRYYERLGILPQPQRTGNRYRLYTEDDVKRLRFIRRARQLDLSLESIADILARRDQGTVPCDYVQEMVQRKAAEIEARIADLEELRQELLGIGEVILEQPTPSPECICQLLEGNGLIAQSGERQMRATWTIEGRRTMHCHGCAQTVASVLADIPHVVWVTASHKTRQVETGIDDPSAIPHISSALKQLGYNAKPLS